MKHLFIIMIFVIASYASWQMLNRELRIEVKSFIKRHIVPLVGVFVVLFLLFIATVQTKPLQLF